MHTLCMVLSLVQAEPDRLIPNAYYLIELLVAAGTISGAYFASRAGTAAAIKYHEERISGLENKAERLENHFSDVSQRVARVEGKLEQRH